eukprot:1141944-Pelagomonas_calceolata.AAC.2
MSGSSADSDCACLGCSRHPGGAGTLLEAQGTENANWFASPRHSMTPAVLPRHSVAIDCYGSYKREAIMPCAVMLAAPSLNLNSHTICQGVVDVHGFVSSR